MPNKPMVPTAPTYLNSPSLRPLRRHIGQPMSRELLWNEFPTDQRGTYFRRFWRSIAPDPAASPPRDITPIDGWRDAEPLGGHPDATTEGMSAANPVLLVRGDLLQRYPTAVVYAIRDLDSATPVERFPHFVGTLKPDVTFLGFPLTTTELMNEREGWHFAIQEPLSETRFKYPPNHSAQSRDQSFYFTIAAGTRSVRLVTSGTFATAADVASSLIHEPVRLLIEARPFLTPPPPEEDTTAPTGELSSGS